jgi:hypothetical protein
MITTSDMTRCGPWQKALLALVPMPLAAVRMAAKNNFLACKNNPRQDKFTKRDATNLPLSSFFVLLAPISLSRAG